MPVRSHVDFCLFARTVHVYAEDLPPEVTASLSARLDAESAAAAWDNLDERRRLVMFHEGYHVWQGARLPFLHWYGIFAFRSILQAFRGLAAVDDLSQWEIFVPALYRLDFSWHAWWTADRQVSLTRELAKRPEGVVDDARLSVIDLVEGATSMAEFQVAAGERAATDPTAFKRHAKRNPAYVDAFRFLARFLDDERLALRALIPMVCRSFSTTDPVRAFFTLAGALESARGQPLTRQFLAQEEPCQWNGFMQALDEKQVAPHFEAPPNSTTDILDPPFCRLTLEGVLDLRFGSGPKFEHPTLARLASEWADRERKDPGFSWLLEQPAWVGPERHQAALVAFQPSLTLMRVHLPDGRGRVIPSSPTMDAGEIRDLLTVWSAIRRAAGIQYSAESRLCHHAGCPFYALNYCNTYPQIPDHFDDCTFPSHLAELRRTLETSSTEEASA